MKSVRALGSRCWGLRIALLCSLAFPGVAFAGDKAYPLQGKVTGLGMTQQMIGGGATASYRTYTVKSATGVYVLVCPYRMNGIHIHSPRECGGHKKLQIGDTIQFRLEKSYAYIPTDKGKEERLVVFSEDANKTSGEKETNP